MPSRHGGRQGPGISTTAQSGGLAEQGPSVPLPCRGRKGGIRQRCAPAGVAGGDASPVGDWLYWGLEAGLGTLSLGGRRGDPLGRLWAAGTEKMESVPTACLAGPQQ